MFEQEYGRNYC